MNIIKQKPNSFMIYCLLLFFSFSCVAQVYQGKIRDAANGNPLPYANLGVIGKSIGGISNDKGIFDIKFDGIAKSDSIMFSYIGYTSKVYSVKDFDFSNSLIELSPEIYDLHNIQVIAKRKIIRIGHKPKRYKGSTGWGENNPSEGISRGTVIEAPANPVILKRFAVKLRHNTFDSVRLRVHIYEFENGHIGKSVLQKNLFFTTDRNGWIFADLEKETVIMDKDFAVGIEWVDAWTNKPEFERHRLSVAIRKSKGYFLTRDSPHQNWGISTNSIRPAFYLEGYNF